MARDRGAGNVGGCDFGDARVARGVWKAKEKRVLAVVASASEGRGQHGGVDGE